MSIEDHLQGIYDILMALSHELRDSVGQVINTLYGTPENVLTGIASDMYYLSRQMSALGVGQDANTKALGNRIDAGYDRLSGQIATTVAGINAHTDQALSPISRTITTNHAEVMDEFAKVQESIAKIGLNLGDALKDLITPLTNILGNKLDDINRTLDLRLGDMEASINSTLAKFDAHMTLALEHTAEATIRLGEKVDRLTDTLHEDISLVVKTLKVELEDHAKVLDKAIRESAAGISNAIIAGDTAEVVALVGLTVAVEAAAITISGAIEAAQVQATIAQAPKLAKDLEIAALILPIITAVVGLLELNNPELMAKAMSDIVDMYFGIGKAVTSQQENKKGS